jgi:hypothetical protein
LTIGEEKPQPYIPLDLDRHVEGKLVASNHVSVGAPNGRLPISSSYAPHNSMPLPTYSSRQHPHAMAASPPCILDGGVYQGYQPTQSNDCNPNAKVQSFS